VPNYLGSELSFSTGAEISCGNQDISAPVEKDSSAPRKFGIRTNQHRIFFQTNVITFF
jgi:hypothetical protein